MTHIIHTADDITDNTDGPADDSAGGHPKPVRPDSPTFADLGARQETVAALNSAGITRAFAIQEYALPIAMRGSDLIGQAPTGTGKTLGFGVPLLERVRDRSEGADGMPQALVVVPTRELCLQVAKDLATAGSTRQVRVLPIYGGVAYETQIQTLTQGTEIVVGTPGRLLDLTRQRHLRLDSIGALVLDEADRMLDLGFLDDVEKILSMLPEQRQTMLFSATMPDPIVALARRFLHAPVTVHATHPDADSGATPLTRQVVYRTHSLNKIEIVARILQARNRGLTMIFSRTKRGVDKVASELDFRGFAAAAVHGDLGQGARERALRAFRGGKVDVLVATDVAARGLDVTGVTHVINYDCPDDPDAYTHRIGRTGRAGATGVAVTFVDWEDMARWRLIDKSVGLDVPEPPETYHTSDWLHSDLDIPTDVTGELPHARRSRAGLSAEREEDLGGRPPGGRRDSGRGRTGSSGGKSGAGRSNGRRSDDRRSDGDERSSTEGASNQQRQRRRRRVTSEPSGQLSGETSPAGQVDTTPTTANPDPNGSQEPGGNEGSGEPRRRRRRGGKGRTGTKAQKPATTP